MAEWTWVLATSVIHRDAAELAEGLLMSSRNFEQRCYKSRLGLNVSSTTYLYGLAKFLFIPQSEISFKAFSP